MTTPENTSLRDPIVHLAGGWGDPSGYIQDMEAGGQRQIVQSDVLPADAPWAEMEALGFVKGAPVAGDDLFVHCTLPDGWTKAGTGHSMHSIVLDERGVERVAVFYKAAFYDRRADAHIANPGYSAATNAIYGDEPVALPEHWGAFTEDERQQTLSQCRAYLKLAEESPRIYGDRADRARALLQLAADA